MEVSSADNDGNKENGVAGSLALMGPVWERMENPWRQSLMDELSKLRKFGWRL